MFRSQIGAIIGVSIVAALAILIASMLLAGRGSTAQTVTYGIIALWWIPFSYLALRQRKNPPRE